MTDEPSLTYQHLNIVMMLRNSRFLQNILGLRVFSKNFHIVIPFLVKLHHAVGNEGLLWSKPKIESNK